MENNNEPEFKPKELPDEFEFNGKKYVYDFNILTCEQCELAREVGEFRVNAQNNLPGSFAEFKKSGATDWLQLIMAYLLREMKGNEILPFSLNKAESETFAFCKNIVGYANVKRLRECLNDFFTNIELSSIGSQLLQNEKKTSVTEMLLKSLISSILTNK